MQAAAKHGELHCQPGQGRPGNTLGLALQLLLLLLLLLLLPLVLPVPLVCQQRLPSE